MLRVPPSKSHTMRALLIASLAEGDSTVRGALLSGDGASALAAVRALGADINRRDDVLTITGVGGDVGRGERDVACGNSGTSMRLFAGAAALGSKERRFDGDVSLRGRPMRPLLQALADLGATVGYEEEGRDVPFTVRGPLAGGSTRVSGVTSQFVSSLLLASPLAPADTHIAVDDLHERPYVGITLWWLEKMGIAVEASPDLASFAVKGGQHYRPIDVDIPADFSSATFPAVAAAVTRSSVTLIGLDLSDPQGDKRVFDILESMGVAVREGPTGISVSGDRGMKGAELDLNANPDALPALAVLGTVARGVTRLGNVAQARLKETDRIAVMAAELRRMGAVVEEEEDGLVVMQSDLHGAEVHGHGDHRVVMALVLAGLVAEGETVVDTAESAEVTYPGFADALRSLGARIEELQD
jgi:3-phosphoshikimate 1-carboxyvinyltransferase